MSEGGREGVRREREKERERKEREQMRTTFRPSRAQASPPASLAPPHLVAAVGLWPRRHRRWCAAPKCLCVRRHIWWRRRAAPRCLSGGGGPTLALAIALVLLVAAEVLERVLPDVLPQLLMYGPKKLWKEATQEAIKCY